MLSSGFHGDVDDWKIGKLKTDAVQGNNLCDRLSKTFRRKTTPNFLLQLKTISCSARYSPNVLWIPQAFDEHWDGEQTHKWLAKFSFGDPFHETLRFFISEICNHSYQMKHSQARSSTRKAKKTTKNSRLNWTIWNTFIENTIDRFDCVASVETDYMEAGQWKSWALQSH